MARKGTWKKGQSGNPKGRPPKGRSWMEQLEYAIKEVEKEKKDRFMRQAIKMAWNEPRMMSAILRKLVPDKTHLEVPVSEYLEAIQAVWSKHHPQEPKKGEQ